MRAVVVGARERVHAEHPVRWGARQSTELELLHEAQNQLARAHPTRCRARACRPRALLSTGRSETREPLRGTVAIADAEIAGQPLKRSAGLVVISPQGPRAAISPVHEAPRRSPRGAAAEPARALPGRLAPAAGRGWFCVLPAQGLALAGAAAGRVSGTPLTATENTARTSQRIELDARRARVRSRMCPLDPRVSRTRADVLACHSLQPRLLQRAT
jgi:hypothetical protein